MTQQEIVRKLLEEYDRKRLHAELACEARIEAIYEAHPEIRAVNREISTIYMRVSRSVLGKPVDAEKYKRDIAAQVYALRDKRARLLAEAGIAPDAFEPAYECAACKDTGFVTAADAPVRERCACFTQRLMDRMYDQAGMRDQRGQTFAAFDETVFPDERVESLGGSQRAYMAWVRRKCEAYARAFPSVDLPNIVMTGHTGLGKTFLLNCIASDVIAKGYTVLRMTAFRFFEHVRRYHMGDLAAGDLTTLMQADLLAIDDLGSEPMFENITIEYLFSVLNERMAGRRHTIIATNLTPAELKERYSERVSSRMLNVATTMVLALDGRDVRTLKR